MNNGKLRSSLTAGAIALVIWIVCALIFDIDGGQIALWALLIFLATTAITYVISTTIGRSKGV